MYRVAIFGSGPSGFFVADELMQRYDENFIEIHMFEKLPVPFGLIRYGVSPDHQKIKRISALFHKIVKRKNFYFYGNVSLGENLLLSDLTPIFDAVVIATGADKNRSISMENSQKNGNYSSISFVGWYNGHPEYASNDFDLSSNKAVIIGNGNVAIDIARILLSEHQKISKYDIPQHTLEKLKNKKIQDVYIVARRNPLKSAFSVQSMRELDTDFISISVEQQYMETILKTVGSIKNIHDLKARSNFEFLYQQQKEKLKRKKNIHFLFELSPEKIITDKSEHVQAIQFKKSNASSTQEKISIDTKCIFYAIGYISSKINSIPYNSTTKIVNNYEGRVQDANNKILPCIYTVGWAKRGATGVIGTNKADAKHVVSKMIEDFTNIHPQKKLNHKTHGRIKINNAKFKPTCYTQWEKIDKEEIKNGEKNGKIREKITSISEMLSCIKTP